MRKTILLFLLLVTSLGFSQNPDKFRDGIDTKLIQLDTLTTTEINALPVPSDKAMLVFDSTVDSLKLNIGGAGWKIIGGGSENTIYTANDTIPDGTDRYVDLGVGSDLFFRSNDLTSYWHIGNTTQDLYNPNGDIRLRPGTGGSFDPINIGDVPIATNTVGGWRWGAAPVADNLGNHTATQNLNMGGYWIQNTPSITNSGNFQIQSGGYLTFVGENSARIMIDWDNNSNTEEFYIYKDNSGTAKLFTVKEDGSIDFNEYGSGSFTGTAAFGLAVDANGNIIETPLGSSLFQNYVNPLGESFFGTRLQPVTPNEGLWLDVGNTINKSNGIMLNLLDVTGNQGYAAYGFTNNSTPYTTGGGLIYYGTSYYQSYLQNNIGLWSTSDLHIQGGKSNSKITLSIGNQTTPSIEELNQDVMVVIDSSGIDFNNRKIVNIPAGTEAHHPVNKSQLDAISSSIPTTGLTHKEMDANYTLSLTSADSIPLVNNNLGDKLYEIPDNATLDFDEGTLLRFHAVRPTDTTRVSFLADDFAGGTVRKYIKTKQDSIGEKSFNVIQRTNDRWYATGDFEYYTPVTPSTELFTELNAASLTNPGDSFGTWSNDGLLTKQQDAGNWEITLSSNVISFVSSRMDITAPNGVQVRLRFEYKINNYEDQEIEILGLTGATNITSGFTTSYQSYDQTFTTNNTTVSIILWANKGGDVNNNNISFRNLSLEQL